ERGTAFGRILPLGHNAERLAEVLLMQPVRLSVRLEVPVVAGDEQVRTASQVPRGHGRYGQPYRRGQCHHQRLVLRRVREPLDGRLQDVRRRLTRRGQGDAVVDEHYGQLGLCASQGEPQPFAAGEQRALRERVQHVDQFLVAEWPRRARRFGSWWHLAFGPEGQRARDIAAERFEEREVVALGDAEGPGDHLTLRLLGQKARKEGTALAL